MKLRPLIFGAAISPALTILTHLLLAGWSRPYDIKTLAIGPYDHRGPLEFAGQRDLLALGAITLTWLLLYGLVALLAGGGKRISSDALLALGLLLGGVLSNSVEICLRGAAMDWLWFATAPGYAAATNWADLSMIIGALGIPLAILRAPAPMTPSSTPAGP